jgi:predicted RND superfamily exporter protein
MNGLWKVRSSFADMFVYGSHLQRFTKVIFLYFGGKKHSIAIKTESNINYLIRQKAMENTRSVEELSRELESREERIRELESLIEVMKAEQEEMIKGFKESTSLLLDRIKNVEEERTGTRPQTAHILASKPLSTRHQQALPQELND